MIPWRLALGLVSLVYTGLALLAVTFAQGEERQVLLWPNTYTVQDGQWVKTDLHVCEVFVGGMTPYSIVVLNTAGPSEIIHLQVPSGTRALVTATCSNHLGASPPATPIEVDHRGCLSLTVVPSLTPIPGAPLAPGLALVPSEHDLPSCEL